MAKKTTTSVRKPARKTERARKPSRGKRTAVTPTLLDDGLAYELNLADIVKVLKAIEKHDRLDSFVRAARKVETSVVVAAATVNFVKTFFAENGMHRDAVGKHIVNAGAKRPQEGPAETMMAAAASRDPFRKCSFGGRTVPR